MYDIIGDIHGHASVLKELLNKLGYTKGNGSFRHTERKLLFVGDYIDRGPEVRETLHLVRSMLDAGQAIALMGNHEFNAIMFNEPDGNGEYLRSHTEKNRKQHQSTLRDFQGKDDEYHSFIRWFKTLPVYYENDDFRAIHACWEQPLVGDLQYFVNDDGALKSEYYSTAGNKGTRLYELLDTLLKGREVKLPDGLSFRDKDGHERDEVRIKWWLNPKEATFQDWSFTEGISGLDDKPVDSRYANLLPHYSGQAKPVFFGHYWLRGQPILQRQNVCCLDYSIGKQDKLVAYRYNGEQELMESELNWVNFS